MNKQNIKLTIIFLLGLPALPLVCIFWLMDRYMIAYNLPPEMRVLGNKEKFISMMFACTALGGIFYLLGRCLGN